MILYERPEHGQVINMQQTMYPTDMGCYRGETLGGLPYAILGNFTSTCYIICIQGSVAINPLEFKLGGRQIEYPSFTLFPRSVACVPGQFDVRPSGEAVFFIIEKYGYRSPINMSACEFKGRLAYIDGCSDTLLISPARLGDPCLNYLFFPPRIKQTQHLHPSIRMGVVLSGEGYAWQDTSLSGQGWEHPLLPGAMFALDESEIHSFRTEESTLEIIAFHPDSDYGPTDTSHPMLNRTYINHGK